MANKIDESGAYRKRGRQRQFVLCILVGLFLLTPAYGQSAGDSTAQKDSSQRQKPQKKDRKSTAKSGTTNARDTADREHNRNKDDRHTSPSPVPNPAHPDASRPGPPPTFPEPRKSNEPNPVKPPDPTKPTTTKPPDH